MVDSFRSLRYVGHGAYVLACCVLLPLSVFPADIKSGSIKMQIRDGRPVVDGVYVNGYGPYRFLVDTGTSVNLIQSSVAADIGMIPTFRIDLTSATGDTLLPGSDGNEVKLGPAQANEQRFLLTDLTAVRRLWPDIHGVLGQRFLSRFDYLFDLRRSRLEFGKQEREGKRTRFTSMDGRATISTSLGDLVLDSGAAGLILFGIEPDSSDGSYLQTVAGSQTVGKVWRNLAIEGRNLWRGLAVTLPNREGRTQIEPGIAGLMPLNLFDAVYICNSEGYLIFR
jgi:hypothetical protein